MIIIFYYLLPLNNHLVDSFFLILNYLNIEYYIYMVFLRYHILFLFLDMVLVYFEIYPFFLLYKLII